MPEEERVFRREKGNRSLRIPGAGSLIVLDAFSSTGFLSRIECTVGFENKKKRKKRHINELSPNKSGMRKCI